MGAHASTSSQDSTYRRWWPVRVPSGDGRRRYPDYSCAGWARSNHRGHRPVPPHIVGPPGTRVHRVVLSYHLPRSWCVVRVYVEHLRSGWNNHSGRGLRGAVVRKHGVLGCRLLTYNRTSTKCPCPKGTQLRTAGGVPPENWSSSVGG